MRVVLVVALVFLLKEAKALLAPVVVALVLTFVLAPGVRALRRHGVPEMVGAGVLVAALLAGAVPLAASLAAPAAQWWERLPSTMAQLIDHFDRLRATLPGFRPPPAPAPPAPATQPRGARSVPAPPPPAAPPADPVKDKLASEGVALTRALLGQGLAFTVSALATVILLYFLLASEHWMVSRTVEAVPRRRTRALVLGGIRAAQREIGRYLASLGLINLGVALATGLAMHATGLPNPTLWAVLAGVLNFVPYLGPAMSFGLILLAGALTFGEFGPSVAPALAYLAIHAIEANLVTPWFVSRRLSLSPLAVFLSVMFWGWIWGIAGALIAVPVLIGVRGMCRRNRRWRLLGLYLEGDARPAPSLRSLLRRRPPPMGTARAGSDRGPR